jgi:hypothetical protein
MALAVLHYDLYMHLLRSNGGNVKYIYICNFNLLVSCGERNAIAKWGDFVVLHGEEARRVVVRLSLIPRTGENPCRAADPIGLEDEHRGAARGQVDGDQHIFERGGKGVFDV